MIVVNSLNTIDIDPMIAVNSLNTIDIDPMIAVNIDIYGV
jgi:hypothetical protein